MDCSFDECLPVFASLPKVIISESPKLYLTCFYFYIFIYLFYLFIYHFLLLLSGKGPGSALKVIDPGAVGGGGRDWL